MRIALFLFLVLLIFKVKAQHTCSEALPFSTTIELIGDLPDSEIGPDYGCIASQYNPHWYYFNIESSGYVQLTLSAINDFDFIIWGPFVQPTCDYNSLSSSNIVDCSYSATNTETPEIGPESSEGATMAQEGEYYMILLTNYSNYTQTLDITIEGTATIGNTPFCENIQFEVDSIRTPSCTNGLNNGYISINVTEEFPPYVFEWSNLASTSYIDNLSSGNYDVTITDARDSSCTTTIFLPVDSVNPMEAIVQTQSSMISCNSNSGIIDITLLDSLSSPLINHNYNINWSEPSLNNSFHLENLPEGNYTFNITNNNTCEYYSDTISVEPTQCTNYFSSEYQSFHCSEPSGFVKIELDSSAIPEDRMYFINWVQPELPDSFFVENLLPDNYTFVVYDTVGCNTDTQSVAFFPQELNNFFNIENTAISCSENINSISINIDTSITNPLHRYIQIDWLDTNLTDNFNHDSLAIGEYSFILSDTSNCLLDTHTVQLFPYTYFSYFELQKNSDSRCDYATGEVLVMQDGQLDLNYFWSNGDTSNETSKLFLPGIYSVTATDQHQCQHIDTVSIEQDWSNHNYSFSTQPSPCYRNDGSISLNAYSGRLPITYEFSDGTIYTQNQYYGNKTIDNLTPNTYFLSITENSGCSKTDTIIVNAEDIAIPMVSTHIVNDRQIDLFVFGDLQYYYSNFKWESLTGGYFDDSLSYNTRYNYTYDEIHNDSTLLKLTLSNSCGLEKDTFFFFNQFTHKIQFKVNVFRNGIQIPYSTVYLYNKIYPKNSYPLLYSDSNDGLFTIHNEGEYLIIPDIQSDTPYEKELYYNGQLLWHQSQYNFLVLDSLHIIDLQVLKGNESSNVFRETSLVRGNIIAPDRFSRPRIILQNEKDCFLTYAKSHGDFSFGEIPEGIYDVLVDRPGYYMEKNEKIQINKEYDFINLNFEVIGDTIYNRFEKQILEAFVFPNPVSDYLKIFNYDGITEIKVYNFSSQLIFHKQYPLMNILKEKSLNVQTWQDGSYIIKIMNFKGEATTQKFIIRH